MGFFRRENKKFQYDPRYYKGKNNPYKIEQKFDEFRTTTTEARGIKNKFTKAIHEYKNSENKSVNKTILIIIAVLTLLFLYIIDFDLSIFLK